MIVIDRIDLLSAKIERAISRFIFRNILGGIASNRLQLIRRTRVCIAACVGLGVLNILLGIGTVNPKYISVSGMLFDIAGLLRIFIDEEWEDLLEPYTEENFPYGPPSNITRELFADEDPEALESFNLTEDADDVPHIARHLHWRRGIAMILFGFVLQMVGTVLS